MLDLVIRGGTVYGATDEPVRADVGIAGDRVVSVADLEGEPSAAQIDATGRAVAPGFINVLSHSYFSVLHDPRSLSELVQGVTTQVFGEGSAMGPLTPRMVAELERRNADLSLRVSWSRLSEYLAHVERQGCTQNVTSFVGHGALRAFGVGYDDRPATPAELDVMRGVLAEELADGALGVATALIYPPESYASTEELVALCEVAARYEGRYISHVRDEGAGLVDAVGELLRISREAGVPAEIYHLKASGRSNWSLMDPAIELVERARSGGLPITADVYPYTASSTGLTSVIPQRFHEGGMDALFDRLADASARAEVRQAMVDRGWEDDNDAEHILLLGMRREENRAYQGRTLHDVAVERGVDPVDAALDLVAHDRSRITVAFFGMSEDNLERQLRLPWVSVGSDGASMAPTGAFLRTSTHPRAYGTFARVLGRYVRERGVLGLAEAVRRMTALPAENLGLTGRGSLAEGSFADAVVFDPGTVTDVATFEDPHQLAVGVSDVVVNGQVTVRAGEHTGTYAGRALRR